MILTRLQRRFIISKLTALGGSRRIWRIWVEAGIKHYAWSSTELPHTAIIREARNLIKQSK
jgi:hypothetical protein